MRPAAPAVRERGGHRRRLEPRTVYVLTTPGPDGHQHCAVLDDEGNGETGTERGHCHQVSGLDVLEEAGHVHELGSVRCLHAHTLGPCGR